MHLSKPKFHMISGQWSLVAAVPPSSLRRESLVNYNFTSKRSTCLSVKATGPHAAKLLRTLRPVLQKRGSVPYSTAIYNYQQDNCDKRRSTALRCKALPPARILRPVSNNWSCRANFRGSPGAAAEPLAREAKRDQDYVIEIAGFRVRKAGDSRKGRRIVKDFLTSSRLRGDTRLR